MLWSSRLARAEIMSSSDTDAAKANDRATMSAPQDLFEYDRQVIKGMGAAHGGVLVGGWRRKTQELRGGMVRAIVAGLRGTDLRRRHLDRHGNPLDFKA